MCTLCIHYVNKLTQIIYYNNLYKDQIIYFHNILKYKMESFKNRGYKIPDILNYRLDKILNLTTNINELTQILNLECNNCIDLYLSLHNKYIIHQLLKLQYDILNDAIKYLTNRI